MPAVEMNADFNSLGLQSELLVATQRKGYARATAIQMRAIPLIIDGKDVKAKADTGTGKTAAFALSLLERYLRALSVTKPKSKGNQIANLILVPTRELAIQIADVIKEFSLDLHQQKPKIVCVYGGVNITPQMLNLRGGADFLLATPGRLLDLAAQNAVRFDHLQSLVLDEADRLLQLGFEIELQAIIKLLPKKRQNLLFSATFPPELDNLINGLLHNPVFLAIEEAKPAEVLQLAIQVASESKNALLAAIIKQRLDTQVLIFASAKHTCNRLVLKLEKAGILAQALHSDKSQASRLQALNDFKQGRTQVLIATDIAARGIDIEQLPLVINFDLPRSPNDYVHRIGRTGRAGQAGEAISLISADEEAHFRLIEKRIKRRVVREDAALFLSN